jgi:hypothetical protein
MLHTASEGISLARKLENDSATFYEELAQCYTRDAEVFLSFAKENKKNVTQIERTYYGVITDAIEGGYAFNIDPDDFTLNTTVAEGTSYADVLEQSVGIEEKIIEFYTLAATQSKSLMADLPRAFLLVVKKRKDRRQSLESLLK